MFVRRNILLEVDSVTGQIIRAYPDHTKGRFSVETIPQYRLSEEPKIITIERPKPVPLDEIMTSLEEETAKQRANMGITRR